MAAAGVTPMADEMTRAFGKIEAALPDPARKFLDRLPAMIKAKATGRRTLDGRRTREVITRLTEASLARRRVEMIYHSVSSRRTRTYIVDPLRLTAADGGMYLTAWVEAYEEMRTFAVERIRGLAVRDEQFELRPLPAEPFANSLGAFSGPPEDVVIAFDHEVADYVTSRDWHRSQIFSVRDDGSVVMRLHVCSDRPLRTWILGFGGAARVVAPASLARAIYEEFEAGRERYTPRLPFDSPRTDRLDPVRALDAFRPRQLRMGVDYYDDELPFAVRRA
jgi:predicted DNA-binding transcriptional regulator YafY